jgi:hypothetical protein
MVPKILLDVELAEVTPIYLRNFEDNQVLFVCNLGDAVLSGGFWLVFGLWEYREHVRLIFSASPFDVDDSRISITILNSSWVTAHRLKKCGMLPTGIR